jgi:hypothetical protein
VLSNAWANGPLDVAVALSVQGTLAGTTSSVGIPDGLAVQVGGASKRRRHPPLLTCAFPRYSQPVVHPCLLAPSTDEQLNRMTFVSLPAKSFTQK